MRRLSWGIGTRVWGGFGTVLGLMVAIAAIGVFEARSLGEDVTRLGDLADDTNLVGRLGADVAEVELALSDLILLNSAETMAKARATQDQLRKRVGAAKQEINKPERVALLGELDRSEAAYAIGFEKSVKSVEHRDRILADTLNPTGARMRIALSEIVNRAAAGQSYETAYLAGAVQEDLLLARLHVAKFLDTEDAKEAERARVEFKEIEAKMPRLDAALVDAGQRRDFEAVRRDLPVYQQGFDRLVDAIAERTAATKDLDRVAAEMNARIEAMKKSLLNDQASLREEVRADVRSASLITLLFGAATILAGAVIALLIARGLVPPIRKLTGTMRRLADGEHNIEVPATERGDEIGQMANTVLVFKENALARVRLEAEQKTENETKERRRELVEAAIHEFERSVTGSLQTLAAASTEMRATAEAMSATADETTRQATTGASASEQTTSNVHSVASAAEQLAASITEISQQVSHSAKVSGTAVQDAERTNGTVQGLAEAAQKIGAVVQLINDIAGQTNLLALNATIEAARAGDAGKGFAVVASEVKSLANQTAKATDDISAQISAMQDAVNDSVGAIATISKRIEEMNSIASTIAAAVEQQGAATREISRSVQQAAAGTTQVSGAMTNVSQAAGETNEAASNVLNAAGSLSKQAETLRAEVDSFLERMRAA